MIGIEELLRCFNPLYATLEIFLFEILTLISYSIWFSTGSTNEPSIEASLQLKLFVPSQQPKVYTLLRKYTSKKSFFKSQNVGGRWQQKKMNLPVASGDTGHVKFAFRRHSLTSTQGIFRYTDFV
jgi:hypothetical protein